VCGCMGVWVHGCMSVWVYECMGVEDQFCDAAILFA
jgi:hypothetical protein